MPCEKYMHPLHGLNKFLGEGLRLLPLAYKRALSPLLPVACRFQPTCAEYASEALQKHGALRGSWLALRRVMRCHPWGNSGIDPVPPCH